MKSTVLVVIVFAIFATTAFASHGGIVLSGYLNEDGEIVLVVPHVNAGVRLESGTQNLVPLPPGDLSADPSPYDFILDNNEGMITWASLGVPTYIGGSFNTHVRLTDGDAAALTGHYGGTTPEFFRIFEEPAPELTATFDVGGRLLVHGNAPELERVGIQSPRPVLGRPFNIQWFNDLEGIDGALSLPFSSRIYPVSADFDLVAIYCQADGNCREIEFETEFLCEPTFGDFNGDNHVGFADFLILTFNFGKEVPDHRYGDADCNGRVEFADFLVNSSCFGCKTVGAQPVPEPRAGLVMTVAVISMIHAIRKRNVNGAP